MMATLLRRLVLRTSDLEFKEDNPLTAMMAYTTLVSKAPGISLFKIVYGIEMRLGIDPYSKIDYETNNPTNHVIDLKDVYKRGRDVMKKRAKRADNRLSAIAVRKVYWLGNVVRI